MFNRRRLRPPPACRRGESPGTRRGGRRRTAPRALRRRGERGGERAARSRRRLRPAPRGSFFFAHRRLRPRPPRSTPAPATFSRRTRIASSARRPSHSAVPRERQSCRARDLRASSSSSGVRRRAQTQPRVSRARAASSEKDLALPVVRVQAECARTAFVFLWARARSLGAPGSARRRPRAARTVPRVDSSNASRSSAASSESPPILLLLGRSAGRTPPPGARARLRRRRGRSPRTPAKRTAVRFGSYERVGEKRGQGTRRPAPRTAFSLLAFSSQGVFRVGLSVR